MVGRQQTLRQTENHAEIQQAIESDLVLEIGLHTLAERILVWPDRRGALPNGP